MATKSFSRRTLTAVLALAALGFTCSAQAAIYYWNGGSPGGAVWNSTAGGTNWSSLYGQDSDPGTVPSTADTVYFVNGGATNFSSTTLGQNFSINSLIFTPDANSPIGIGGANTLTLGSGGLAVLSGASSGTISANVAIGAVQTWTENGTPSTSNVTISGVLSGTSNFTLRGTGSTQTPSGTFIFSASNTYSGALTLLNNYTSLTLNGGGALSSASGITLDGGTSLILDNTALAAAAPRLGLSVPLTSNGGSITLKGNASSSISESIGTLTVGSGTVASGTTNLNVNDSGQATSFTITNLAQSTGQQHQRQYIQRQQQRGPDQLDLDERHHRPLGHFRQPACGQ